MSQREMSALQYVHYKYCQGQVVCPVKDLLAETDKTKTDRQADMQKHTLFPLSFVPQSV